MPECDSPLAERPVDELALVEAWREDVLLNAGYPSRQAHELALNQQVDLHQATDLLARDCPFQLAMKILR